MPEWLVFSSKDMVSWESHPVPLKPTDFSQSLLTQTLGVSVIVSYASVMEQITPE